MYKMKRKLAMNTFKNFQSVQEISNKNDLKISQKFPEQNFI